jgi:Protein of unknown function (DUF3625).
MKCFKKALLASFIAGLVISGHAISSEKIQDSSESKDKDQNNKNAISKNNEDQMAQIELDSGLSGELSKEELDLIKRKKHTLVKYLYEQQELDSARDVLADENRDKAYEETKRQKIPLSPEEILELRKLDIESKKAENAPLSSHGVKLEMRSIDLDVDAPKPIVLNVATGYASSIVFYDQSGAPWPIDGDIIGDENSFGSKMISKQKHIAVFEITKEFAESNALINLEGLSVPIVVKLVGHDGIVDSRLSVRIPKFGPSAQVQPFVHNELENASREMMGVLNGDKLSGSKRFELNGVPGEVTYKDDTIYIRTRANLISPPWRRSVVSPTGYKVYELPPVTNLLFSIDGEMRNATIEKGFDVNISHKSSIYEEK